MIEGKDGAPVLPVQLSEGVTAILDGLEMHASVYFAVCQFLNDMDTDAERVVGTEYFVWSWPAAAERLWYREGEPWCTSSDGAFTLDIVCRSGKDTPSGLSGYIFGVPIKDNPLHRLAAILCDGAEEFRVLHWCVHNLALDRDTREE